MNAEDAAKVFKTVEEAEQYDHTPYSGFRRIALHTLRVLFAERDNLTVGVARWEAEHEDYKLELSRENILQALKIQELEDNLIARSEQIKTLATLKGTSKCLRCGAESDWLE